MFADPEGMTCRIEKGRAKVVVDHHSTGATYLSIRIDGAAFGIMLDEEERKRLSKALWYGVKLECGK